MSSKTKVGKARAIQISSHGASDKLQLVELPIAIPAADQVLVHNHACGVNMIDIYQREGIYPLERPAIMGNEAAGEIIAIGERVTDLKIGQRVAYATAGPGCYTTHRLVASDKIVLLPDNIDTKLAAASLLRGLTAEYLACRLWPLAKGSKVLVTAAAGGVGVILCQWLVRLGVDVIGVVGSASKKSTALANGCKEVIVGYATMDRLVRSIHPAGVEVVFDSIGQLSFSAALGCLCPRGCLVSYGNASGAVEPFPLLQLAKKGSLFVTRPTLDCYCRTQEELGASAAAWFTILDDGLKLPDIVAMPLTAAAQAQDLLSSRKLEGLLVLTT